MSIYAEAGRVPPEQIEIDRLTDQIALLTQDRDSYYKALGDAVAKNEALTRERDVLKKENTKLAHIKDGTAEKVYQQAQYETALDCIDIVIEHRYPHYQVETIKAKYGIK